MSAENVGNSIPYIATALEDQSYDGENKSASSESLNNSGIQDDADLWKRKKILNEIYDTEKTYNHQLNLLTTIFLQPLKISQILPPQVVEGLFSNVEAIQTVSVSDRY